MLTEKLAQQNIADLFLAPDQFLPFPRYADRDAWAAVTDNARSFWLDKVEEQLDYAWPAVRMTYYLETTRSGNISHFLDAHMERRSRLGIFVLAECLEGKRRFLEPIIDGVFTICEETSWMQPLANTRMRQTGHCAPTAEDHVVDLAASETAALLAWTDYLFRAEFDRIDRRISERIRDEVRTRILIPYQKHDDYWWHGFTGSRVNNWNPWCNGNVLMSVLLLEPEPDARDVVFRKALRSLDVFLNTHSPDGCCDEGPMYWGRSGGSLYDCLELLGLASRGAINVFAEPLVQDIGRYIAKVYIDGDYFVDFADGDARATIPADLVYGYGKQIGDKNLVRLGASSSRYWGGVVNWFPLYRYLRDLFQEKERLKEADGAPYSRDSWMGHAQVMTARQKQGSPEGFFLAAKGGHNLESHNHNDVGNFIIYVDGLPLIIDLGTEEYTTKTFGPDRFSLWYLQSAYHNLPTIGGQMQRDGRDYAARDASYQMDDGSALLALDISQAYPAEAGIRYWRRAAQLDRTGEGSVTITDDFELERSVDSIYWSMMSVSDIKPANNCWLLEYAPGKHVCLAFDPDQLAIRSERIAISDRRLGRYWGSELYRLVLTLKQPLAKGIVQVRLQKTESR